MAHKKFYGICENKCRVELTDRVVKAKFSQTVDLEAGETKTLSFPLNKYGITSNEGVVALISLTSALYTTPSGSVLEFNHQITGSGTLVIQIRNKTGSAIKGVSFNVCVL